MTLRRRLALKCKRLGLKRLLWKLYYFEVIILCNVIEIQSNPDLDLCMKWARIGLGVCEKIIISITFIIKNRLILLCLSVMWICVLIYFQWTREWLRFQARKTTVRLSGGIWSSEGFFYILVTISSCTGTKARNTNSWTYNCHTSMH